MLCVISWDDSAPDSRPRDGHVLCSHIDALYLISKHCSIKLAAGCDSLVLRLTLCQLSRCMQKSGPVCQSVFCLGDVSQLLRCCVVESARGEGSRAVEATTVLWTNPFVASSHSSLVKCSVSYHGTNSAPSSRPCD